MKKQAGIKILTGVVVSVVALILFNAGGTASENIQEENSSPNNINAAIASQFNDNIRDVSARLMETEKRMKRLDAQNKTLAKENARLTASKESGGVVRETISPEILASMKNMERELEALKTTQRETTASIDYPLGQSGKTDLNRNAGRMLDVDAWLMKHRLSEADTEYWKKWNAKKRQLHKKIGKPVKKTVVANEKTKNVIPYYTIPAGSDLGNTTLLTALIGEVPIDGKLMQPLFPFSAIISRGDLMASNGMWLPEDITGMKVSGYAIGVGSFLDNISCVRAYVTSALFTFQDGHFVVVGKEQMSNSVDLVNNDSLGYLTTAHGNPCIHGQYHTNAPTVLAAMLAAGGVNGAGKALAQWQMTYFAGPEGGAAVPTGSLPAFAAGGAMSEGSVKIAEWLEKRIQGSFDMVFVPASEPVLINGIKSFRINRMVLHLTQTIKIDKALKGRVLNYGHKQHYTHDFSLG